MKLSDIEKMSSSEKLQTIESLWDSLLDEKTELASPQWHAQVLAARTAKIADGSARFVSIDTLKNFPS
jgi:hypothetical protein